MQKLYYYKREEAEEFKREFLSWIGKKAHIGKGITQTLEAIDIKPKRSLKSATNQRELFRIEFHFENKKKLSALEFLFYNALISSGYITSHRKSRPNNAA